MATAAAAPVRIEIAEASPPNPLTTCPPVQGGSSEPVRADAQVRETTERTTVLRVPVRETTERIKVYAQVRQAPSPEPVAWRVKRRKPSGIAQPSEP